MIVLNLITGLFFIGIGFLVKSSPDLIAGYNTMPKEKRKNVDIVGLSTFMKKGFIIMGITMIILSLFIKFFRLEDKFFFWVMTFITLAGTIILVIKAQKFDGNKKNSKNLIQKNKQLSETDQ